MADDLTSRLVGRRGIISGAGFGSVASIGAFAAGRWQLGVFCALVAVAMVLLGIHLLRRD